MALADAGLDCDAGKRFLAIVNPAAGGGRCGRRAPGILAALRSAGIEVDTAETRSPGEATWIARHAYAAGRRRLLAVGGDGTSFEIINGVFPQALVHGRVTLGFLPLGTGNSFLRDFMAAGADPVEHALEAIGSGRTQRCDVIRLEYTGGVLYYINLLSLGFTAEVATLVNRRFKKLGPLGYLLGVLVCLARLSPRAFPFRGQGEAEFDRRPCLFVTFSNSKFTGGRMMIAPLASATDGQVEMVRWGPIGRPGLLYNLPRLFDGSHIHHPLAERQATQRVEFALDGPVEVMVDGEVKRLQCVGATVFPGAFDAIV